MKKRMEQSIGHASNWYTEEEKQVAEFLLELSRSEPAFPRWVRKRRRSAIQDDSPYYYQQTRLHNQPSSDPQTQTPLASSPATPLSFSPTESEENPNNLFPRKTSLKRKKEHYHKVIEDLTKTKASLEEELDNVTRYRDQLKTINSKLKAKKQELINGSKTDSEFGQSMPWVYVNGSVNPSNSKGENEEQKKSELQPITPHHLALNQVCGSSSPILSNSRGIAQLQNPMASTSSNALGHVNSDNGPLTIPDLNSIPDSSSVPDSEEFTQLANKDLSRVMAAQARHRRFQIVSLKNFPRKNKQQPCGYR